LAETRKITESQRGAAATEVLTANDANNADGIGELQAGENLTLSEEAAHKTAPRSEGIASFVVFLGGLCVTPSISHARRRDDESITSV
jgi:hypothetical protein